MGQFRCTQCGSVALAYPSILRDEAPIRCGSCDAAVTTWGALKRRTSMILGAARTERGYALSADPVSVEVAEAWPAPVRAGAWARR